MQKEENPKHFKTKMSPESLQGKDEAVGINTKDLLFIRK